ncbi:MAG: pyruvate, phosphate dikinase, partial [Nanoarchaeota archaeon]
MAKYVYFFGEGRGDQKALLGGKGAGLSQMTRLGIPVPPGFTITTAACNHYYSSNRKKYPAGLKEQVNAALIRLEQARGRTFGDAKNPLLVSVRSGAKFSMPGMMDTILNLGINDPIAKGLSKATKNERFVYDAYRRFIQMFGNVVLGVEHEAFETVLSAAKKKQRVKLDSQLNAASLQRLVKQYKALIKKETGNPFPDDPRTQLWMAVNAVFESWNNQRAQTYRRLNNIPDNLGTAVNIQSMVFGNFGKTSGTGVGFTRNPSTGENKFYGEYLMNAQGEDVVAGIRTPHPISDLRTDSPKAYRRLLEIRKILEQHYHDMNDIEFTIERGELFMLQTRVGKRTARAAVRMAVEMVGEGLINKKEAVLRVQPAALDQLLHKTVDPRAKATVLAKGLPASPGAAVGQVYFTAAEAKKQAEKKKVILVRTETSPEDIDGMHASQGILTARGGMTSHAAVVARGMGTCCVAGCEAINVDEKKGQFTVKGKTIRAGDWITLNGSSGEVILGQATLMEPKLDKDFETLMGWADTFRRLKVRTNADTPHDAKVARAYGAQGIGLCRTEHMFFNPARIKAV